MRAGGRLVRGLVRPVLIGLALVRIAIGGLALLAIPAVYEDHFLWVVAMRPTKEILLAAGFQVRVGDLFVVPLMLVALPLLVLGVWLWYFLGEAYGDDLLDHDLPGIAGRLLHRDRVLDLQEALCTSGWKLVFFGRMAAFPSSVLAAAAGSSRMDRRTFFIADLAGALVSLAAAVTAGYLLGRTYEQAGAWLTAVGVVVLVALAVGFGRHLKHTSSSRGGGGRARRDTSCDDLGGEHVRLPSAAAQ
jgi:membrane-associated protein